MIRSYVRVCSCTENIFLLLYIDGILRAPLLSGGGGGGEERAYSLQAVLFLGVKRANWLA